jgi:hypothetical protein
MKNRKYNKYTIKDNSPAHHLDVAKDDILEMLNIEPPMMQRDIKAVIELDYSVRVGFGGFRSYLTSRFNCIKAVSDIDNYKTEILAMRKKGIMPAAIAATLFAKYGKDANYSNSQVAYVIKKHYKDEKDGERESEFIKLCPVKAKPWTKSGLMELAA